MNSSNNINMQEQFQLPPYGVLLSRWVVLSSEQHIYLDRKFREICEGALAVDYHQFDIFCNKIHPFCEEIYQMGKNLQWPNSEYRDDGPLSETPNDQMIFEVGASIEAHIVPHYKKHLKKSEAFYKMVCDVMAEDKYEAGRCSFIELLWPRTGRKEGVDVKRLLKYDKCCFWTVSALLKLRDGRYVKEVKKLQERMPKDTWITWRKKVALYIERYDVPKN